MARFSFYNTSRWRKLRLYIINRAGGICEICNVERGKIADHIEEVTDENVNDDNIVWNPDNLQCVCQDCHNRKHHGNGGVLSEGLMFDEEGNLIEINKGDRNV